MRCFVSIDVEKPVQDRIERIQNRLREVEGHFALTDPKTAHITLKFLGEQSECEVREIKKRLREVLKGCCEFCMKTTSVGVFGSAGVFRTIWLGVSITDELTKMYDALNYALPDISETKLTFTPHITIARVKDVKDKSELVNFVNEMNLPHKLQEISFSVREITLKKSELTPRGPEYATIEKYPLLRECA